VEERLKSYDVVIIGGGPSGATAARHCSQNSLRTLLLEKMGFPRYKPCAGGVTVAALEELGFDLDEGVVEKDCCGVRLQVKDFRKDVIADSALFFTVDRSRFDEFLVKQASMAGAEVHDGEGALGIEREGHRVVVRTDRESYRANLVIGADGFFSTVRKALKREFDSDEVMLSVLCEVPLDEEEIYRRCGDLLLVHYGFIDRGYAWIFPKRGSVTAGIGGAVSDTRILVSGLKRFLCLHGLDDRVKIRGGNVPVTMLRHPVYDERVMLTGDAAGFVDSFTGEGIRYAIISGKIAAQTAADCHERGDFSLHSVSLYQKQCEERFGENLRYAARVKDLLLRFDDLVMDMVVKNSSIMDRYLRTMTGEMGYRSFAGWVKQQLPAYFLKRVFSLGVKR
jgi:geranylgeranyl reductase family protein